MGLAQKRMINQFQQNVFPSWKQQFDAAVGAEIPFEIMWDTLTEEGRDDPNFCFDSWNKVYFDPLLEAFKGVCTDDMGREAVKGSVKKIVIDGTSGSSPEVSAFDSGVFRIKHKPFSNLDYGQDRAKKWRQMIESNL